MSLNSFGSGMSVGILVGAVGTGLALRHTVRELLKSDEVFKNRQKALVDHMLATMGPYVPKHILTELRDYVEFNLIITNEEGPK
jgi:hypothetical protein